MKRIGVIPAVTYAIGDIHGRADLLTQLLVRIRNHRKSVSGISKIIFLGDYVDRGPQDGQRAVLKLLRSRGFQKTFDEVILLKGNHEAMLAATLERFADDLRSGIPADVLRERYGNAETAFGLSRQVLRRFLNQLPLYHSDGFRLFTHAGMPANADVRLLPEEQLLWYRGPVQDKAGRLVVHGHTPVLWGPQISKHAVNIDTGAVMTDQLTCAVFLGNSLTPTFLSTEIDPKKAGRLQQEREKSPA